MQKQCCKQQRGWSKHKADEDRRCKWHFSWKDDLCLPHRDKNCSLYELRDVSVALWLWERKRKEIVRENRWRVKWVLMSICVHIRVGLESERPVREETFVIVWITSSSPRGLIIEIELRIRRRTYFTGGAYREWCCSRQQLLTRCSEEVGFVECNSLRMLITWNECNEVDTKKVKNEPWDTLHFDDMTALWPTLEVIMPASWSNEMPALWQTVVGRKALFSHHKFAKQFILDKITWREVIHFRDPLGLGTAIDCEKTTTTYVPTLLIIHYYTQPIINKQ